ncbi:prenyltransferase [Haloglomus salinum]|jgi:1,4-dihydroxy-2-naphthoate octaprenyltransferase|uniref:prenyltransferase n=1 Tax=Haloglomus salinum TaxID=2962673 RepID=UPI0020C9AB2F|nr:prenyltransferase [Haloglomus salinum]
MEDTTDGALGEGNDLDPSAVDPAPRRVRDADRSTVLWALWTTSRPDQLLLVVAVYAMGATIAVAQGAALSAGAALAGLAALLPTAASIHYANEYADYETDALTDRTPFSGGSGGLHAARLPRRLARDATLVTAAVAALVAGLLWATGALPTVAAAVLVVAAVLGWGYSLPPLALAWNGLGELDNAVLGGLLLPHYGAAALAGTFDLAVCLAVLPFTALVFVNLLATQWPDRRADAAVGKYTLPTRWSPARLRVAYVAGVVVAFGSLAALWGHAIPPLVAAATLLALPFVAWGMATYTRDEWPFPTVAAMVVAAVAQLVAWAVVAGLPARVAAFPG